MLIEMIVEAGKTVADGVNFCLHEFSEKLARTVTAGHRLLYGVTGMGWFDKADDDINRRVRLEQDVSVSTPGALPTEIYLSPVPAAGIARVIVIEAMICCCDPANPANYGRYNRQFTFTWDGVAVLALCPGAAAVGNDCESGAGMDVTAAVVAVSTAQILVTGAALTNLNWFGTVRVIDNAGGIL